MPRADRKARSQSSITEGGSRKGGKERGEGRGGQGGGQRRGKEAIEIELEQDWKKCNTGKKRSKPHRHEDQTEEDAEDNEEAQEEEQQKPNTQ